MYTVKSSVDIERINRETDANFRRYQLEWCWLIGTREITVTGGLQSVTRRALR